jgi:hypothetical protein
MWSLYQTSHPSTWYEKHIVNNVRHCVHSAMLLLCAPHHLHGVLSRLHLVPRSSIVLVQFSQIQLEMSLNALNHQMLEDYLLMCQSSELLLSIWHIAMWRLHTFCSANFPRLPLSLMNMHFHFTS